MRYHRPGPGLTHYRNRPANIRARKAVPGPEETPRAEPWANYGALTLEKTRQWIELIGKGIDPAIEDERRRAAQQRKREGSFAAAAEEVIAYIKRQKLRTAPVDSYGIESRFIERELRQKFIPRWRQQRITRIDTFDVGAFIRAAVDRGPTYQAFHNLALWARAAVLSRFPHFLRNYSSGISLAITIL